MNVLVTGADGQLGRQLTDAVKNRKLSGQWFFTDLGQLDITDEVAVSRYVQEHRISVLINCAAYTQVDQAEKEPDKAFRINALGTGTLAAVARQNDTALLHISTDYVFSGQGFRPYREDDEAQPVNCYGQTKLEGEKRIFQSGCRGMIIRTSWLYAPDGHNFVHTLLRKAEQQDELFVVNDQIGSPTYAGDLADAILTMLPCIEKASDCRIYHFANEGVASWYDFACAIMEFSEKNVRVVPVDTAAFATLAKRPFYSVLDKSAIKKAHGLDIPHWRESLRSCLEKIRKAK